MQFQRFQTHLLTLQTFFQHAVKYFRDNQQDQSVAYAAEWLLDNAYILQQTFRQIEEDLSPGFFIKLPLIQEGALTDFPRIFAVAQEIILNEHVQLDSGSLEKVKRFVSLYDVKSVRPLSMGELWAFPIMLRIGILEVLAQTLSKITDLKLSASLPGFNLASDVRDDHVVASCFGSLRTFATQDWRLFFESVSHVERLLIGEPANIYARMDKDTRDLYRKVIENLAEATQRSEIDVTQLALALAAESPEHKHVGYFLIDRGRAILEARLNFRARGLDVLRRWSLQHPTRTYLGSIAVLTGLILFAALSYLVSRNANPLQLIVTTILILIVASTVAISLVDWLITLLLPPRVLPKLDFREGIPSEQRSMVVVPTLLTNLDEVRSLVSQLELHYLRNPDPHLHFALLTDFVDASTQHCDDDAALIHALVTGVNALNNKYPRLNTAPTEASDIDVEPQCNGDTFYIFHRERQWNVYEGVWMGWERKRGKLHQLNRRLRDSHAQHFDVEVGCPDILAQIKYIITLDADTAMQPHDAARLVATAAHPLNEPRFDPKTNRLITGYTILQPRTEIIPMSASQSLFSRIFSGDVGLDLYTNAVSNVYQDLFGAGIYVGKGLYHIDAFERSLQGRVPPNTLLSHDLFEGIQGRVGLVTDVVLYEDYPPNYLVFIRRSRRWIRGDWQLLPWLLPRVPHATHGTIKNNLSVIDGWKIFDNLRRSLLAPALLMFFVVAWTWLPGSTLAWTLFVAITPAVAVATGALSALAQVAKRKGAAASVQPLRYGVLRWMLALTVLPYETVGVVSSIGVTLFRVFITRRNMLRWTTAAQVIRSFGYGLTPRAVWLMMLPAIGMTGLLSLLILWMDPIRLRSAIPILLAWLFSAQIAYQISVPIKVIPDVLTDTQQRLLRRVAQLTWLFFERFVGPDDHWLPPDNYQEFPRGKVTSHTSPTNIGLLMLSTMAARDLGYIGLQEMTSRLTLTLSNLGRLETYRGHLLNWYDTRSMQPLMPRYVSTVDSGNLAGCFIALRQGCREMRHAEVFGWQNWQGLLDTLALFDDAALSGTALRQVLSELQQQVLNAQATPEAWLSLLEDIQRNGKVKLDQAVMTLVEEHAQDLTAVNIRALREASDRVQRHLHGMQREVDALLPWLVQLSGQSKQLLAALPEAYQRDLQSIYALLHELPRLDQIGSITRSALAQLQVLRTQAQDSLQRQTDAVGLQSILQWCDQLEGFLQTGRGNAQALLDQLSEIEGQCAHWEDQMDFGFLFNQRRKIFHIGYNLNNDRLDENYYDLLASEARIASIIAIAHGDVPVDHWLHLGRGLADVDGQRVLLSWSATMFEYLMPLLLMRSYEGTLLQASNRAAVRCQQNFARQQKVPWGISESGFYEFDGALNYQYRAFGVPGLGFKRNLGEDLVITPYASALALPLGATAVAKNFESLVDVGMLGSYGFFEAIDFTAKRLTLGNDKSIVQEYMAHHQGMILLSLTNYLCGSPMQRRFHADPRIHSVELLLQEKVPLDAPTQKPHGFETATELVAAPMLNVAPWQPLIDAPVPQVHYLSNGRYGVLITSAGGGFSRWRDVDLTRWRADTTMDNWGSWIYLQDADSGEYWSATRQPANIRPELEEVQFSAHRAFFRQHNRGIAATLEIVVAPEDDVEIRRLSLTNHSEHPRRMNLSSYGEVILTAQANDARHPAFNKLFIESEYAVDVRALIYHRRPRSSTEAQSPIYLAHMVVLPGHAEGVGKLSYETDRARFFGRTHDGAGRHVHRHTNQIHIEHGSEPAHELDPIFSLTQEITLAPHTSLQLAWVTVAANSRSEVIGLLQRYRSWHMLDRATEQSRARAENELRQLEVDTPQLERFQKLLSVLHFPHRALRGDASALAANRKGQSGLWAYGLSGDYPILLVHVNDDEDFAFLQALLQAHTYWRNRQLKIDLVMLIQKPGGYNQALREKAHRLLARMHSDGWLNRRGGVFIVSADQMGVDDGMLLHAVAGVILDASAGSLAEQLNVVQQQPTRLPQLAPTRLLPAPDQIEATPPLLRPTDLQFDNGLGGFSADGREYLIYIEPGQCTPAPWINVVANPEFGFLVSETGGGYTWALNSGENRLTPWRNDAVHDTPGEVLYLRDEETTQVWSPMPEPSAADAPYLITHGAGYSRFAHHSHGLKQQVDLYVAPDAPVKIIKVQLENVWAQPRRITATFYVDWVLGVHRDLTQAHIVTEYDDERQALLARNAYSMEFGERVAFLAASRRLHSLTADRVEFVGRMGDLQTPAALGRVGLAGAVGAGLDACGALQLHFDLQPGETQVAYFLLGQGASRAEALRLVQRFQDPAQAEAAWQNTQTFWDELLGTIQVQTPDPAMNLMLNHWLPYQTLACRIWGRSAFYQSSGAYGYRDQLQDVMALLHARPALAREQIVRAAQYQFDAGDVLHWWHPPGGRGVRTHCSDDLLWLPYVTAEYIRATNDVAILDEMIPVLTGPPLDKDEDDRYGQYPSTPQSEAISLFEHCTRAIDRASTSGAHGQPLMGSGDWNDGMSRVGIGGKGESVWLGWFLYRTLIQFAEICEVTILKPSPVSESVGEGARVVSKPPHEQLAITYRQRAATLAQAIEQHAWDGDWYLRAFYDDGTPLGSAKNSECQIDAIAQSWAVLSGAGDPSRARQAMQAVHERLVRDHDNIIMVLTPPFDKTTHDPGYIKGYVPGIRENGGQYTHAAVWTTWAFAELGMGDEAERLFRMLNPIYHADTPDKLWQYKVEPYVVAADVYTAAPRVGRGGWTWYTGSAGWLYRLGIEGLLGIHRKGDALEIKPVLPAHWPGYTATYRLGGKLLQIKVQRAAGSPDGYTVDVSEAQ